MGLECRDYPVAGSARWVKGSTQAPYMYIMVAGVLHVGAKGGRTYASVCSWEWRIPFALCATACAGSPLGHHSQRLPLLSYRFRSSVDAGNAPDSNAVSSTIHDVLQQCRHGGRLFSAAVSVAIPCS